MQPSERPRRRDGIATRWRPRSGVIAYATVTVCLSSLVATGTASAQQSSCTNQYPGDPGVVATSPAQFEAAKASWETPEYGYYTGHNPSTPGTAVNAP